MAAGPEDILQIQVVRFLRIAAPDLLFFHAANGGSRHPAEARKFKDMGVLPGAPDLCFVLPDGRFGAIELKVGKNRLTTDQLLFREACNRASAPYAVCRSLDEVEATLRDWGVKLRARAQ